jgi:lysophospholipase L1-like esterase
MFHDNLEFHNIAELAAVEGCGGLRLQRVPEHVRAQLEEGTAGVMLSPADGEIRFRMAEGRESVTIRLSSESPTTVYVYHGPFQGRSFILGKEPKDYTIKLHKRTIELIQLGCPGAQYDPGLVRLCFGGPYPEPTFYHGHGDGILPPRPQDVPKRTYLAYGTSITHGTDFAGAATSYPAHVAWRLGYQLRNLGASGCCKCEKAMADYLAEQPCDLVTLELSVNMLGESTAAEFRDRAGYLVQRIADSNPARPVVCITLFPHWRDISGFSIPVDAKSTAGEYRQVLRDIVKTLARPNLSLIEGPDLLPDVEGLSFDLLHPSARGMIQIGEELARRLMVFKAPG